MLTDKKEEEIFVAYVPQPTTYISKRLALKSRDLCTPRMQIQMNDSRPERRLQSSGIMGEIKG